MCPCTVRCLVELHKKLDERSLNFCFLLSVSVFLTGYLILLVKNKSITAGERQEYIWDRTHLHSTQRHFSRAIPHRKLPESFCDCHQHGTTMPATKLTFNLLFWRNQVASPTSAPVSGRKVAALLVSHHDLKCSARPWLMSTFFKAGTCTDVQVLQSAWKEQALKQVFSNCMQITTLTLPISI